MSQPRRFSISFAIQLFFFTQLLAMIGGIALALLPFGMVWLWGTWVSHNTNYTAGLSWYAAAATLILVIRFAWQKIRAGQGVADEKDSLSEMLASAGAVVSLPVVMYLASQSIVQTEQSELSEAGLISWSWLYCQTHLDIVSVGLYTAIFPDSISVPETTNGRLVLVFARTLYTLGVVVFVGQLVRGAVERHESTPTTFKQSAGQLGIFAVLFLGYNLIMVSATGIASFVPWKVVAVGTPVLVHLALLCIMLPAMHAVRRRAHLAHSQQKT